jgi:hypothetical protein
MFEDYSQNSMNPYVGMGNIFTTSLIENNKNLILFFKVDEYP